MVSGHLNPGYHSIVSQHSLGLNNPNAEARPRNIDSSVLDEIRSKAKQVWSTRDDAETTYGHYYRDPAIKKRPTVRPPSPTRRNNPHPKPVFLSSHMKRIPGFFNEDETDIVQNFQTQQQLINSTYVTQEPNKHYTSETYQTVSTDYYPAPSSSYPQLSATNCNEKIDCQQNHEAKRPFRGDFLIHPDWKPTLKHHRLPYDY